MKFFAVLVALLLTASQTQGFMIHLDGHASAYPIFADQALIVVSSQVSGRPGYELLALDAANGNVLWRQTGEHYIYTALSDNVHQIYSVEASNLVSRARTNGTILGSLDLSKLAWFKEEEADQGPLHTIPRFGGAPERYRYEIVGINQRTFLLTRRGESGTGCVIHTHSQDWALLDRKTRRMVRVGQGAMMAGTQEALIIWDWTSDKRLQYVTAEHAHDIAGLLKGKIHDWDIQTLGYLPRMVQATRYCTFGLRDRRKDKSTTLYFDERAIYDVENRSLQILTPVQDRTFQLGWANTDQSLIRFSECRREQSSAELQTKRALPLWVESYGLDGKFRGRVTLPTKLVEGQESSRFLSFAGVTPKGWFAFVDTVYARVTNSVRADEYSTKLLLIDASGPKLMRSLDLSSGTSSTVQVMTGRDAVVQTIGNLELPEMRGPTRNHTLTTRLVSLTDGREQWRHNEKVTIRKLN